MTDGTRVQAAIARLGRWTGRADVRRTLLGPSARDLSAGDFWVLGVLAAHAPLRASTLAELQGIDRSSVTAQVRRLERAGLVARSSDPVDGRAALLALTERGRQVRDDIDAAGGAVFDALMREWSPEDRAALAALLDRLTRDLTHPLPGIDAGPALGRDRPTSPDGAPVEERVGSIVRGRGAAARGRPMTRTGGARRSRITGPPSGRPRRHPGYRGALLRHSTHRQGPGAAAAVAVGIAIAAFVAVVVALAAGGASIDVPWAPTLGMRLDLALDGLGILYALLATGIGAAVFTFGAAYLPWHLEHEGRPASEGRRFWPWMVLFMGSMVGLACARDLVVLFVFFDLTAVASYFLIGFDRGRREARGAALMALLVTGVSAVAMLIGAVLLYTEHGTFSLPELFERADGGTTTIVASALIAVAALAKSAQVPLHFWLPRAMAAPTPVSAYLHSAAMVAAGVLVLGRVHPLLARSEVVLDGLLVVGGASIVIGGLLALSQNELKQILAHSTISQYGYVVVLYGIGGAKGAGAAALYVLTHGIAKSALFMTAGAVTVATGETRLSHLGGLARSMPGTAVASGVAAATLAALPLTLGFFKDELFFAAALDAGLVEQVLAVVAASLTFAYIGRFWLGVFAGARLASVVRVSPLLIAPIGALAAIALVAGVLVGPFADLAADAAAVTHGAPVELDPAYHLDARAENLMALGAWALGAALLAAPSVCAPLVRAVAAAGDRAGPRRIYGVALRAINQVSDRLHAAEVRDLRTSVAAVLVPTGVLVGVAFAFTPTEGVYRVGAVEAEDLPIIALLVVSIAAAVTAARDAGRLRPVLALSVLGFALAAVYAVVGAPDVALVAVVVETILTLVFVGVYARLPPAERRAAPAAQRRLRRRNAVSGVIAGVGAFATIWAALSRTNVGRPDAQEQIRLTPDAHGSDVVTVILADFRGLDTLVEITVLATALIGVALLLRRGRAW